ncbi:MAG TPA: hypothetical protein VLK84_09310 [Longimicrobium sp.]|nr:hypothetical protein [Longimicrobium sp.]
MNGRVRVANPTNGQGRPKAYNLYTRDRTFLGHVRGVTNERQSRRAFVAEAAALGYPVATGEITARYDAYGMEPPSALTLEWRDQGRNYTYRPYNPDVDLSDGFFELVRGRYATVDEYHYVGSRVCLRYRR